MHYAGTEKWELLIYSTNNPYQVSYIRHFLSYQYSQTKWIFPDLKLLSIGFQNNEWNHKSLISHCEETSCNDHYLKSRIWLYTYIFLREVWRMSWAFSLDYDYGLHAYFPAYMRWQCLIRDHSLLSHDFPQIDTQKNFILYRSII